MIKRNPSIRPLFTALIVVALGYNDWTLHQKLMTMRLLETGDQTRQRFQRQITALNHQADLWESQADAFATTPTPRGKGAPAAAGKKNGDGDEAERGPQKLANEVRHELIAAWIDRVYGPLFKQLAFNPADLAQLQALIAEKRQAILEAVDAAHMRGINDAAGLREAILPAVKTVDHEIQAWLGEAKYAAFREYQQSLPARSAIDELSAALPPGADLTLEQRAALIKIIEQGQSPGAGGSSVVENLLTNVPAMVNRQDVAAAGSVLSAAQLNALQALQNQQAIQRDLLRLLYPSKTP